MSQVVKATEDPRPDPYTQHLFSDLVMRAEDGVLNQELSIALQDLVASLHDDLMARGGKPVGAIDLKLAFKLDDGMIEIRTEFKVKAPKQVRRRSMYYITPENKLTSVNAKQPQLFPPRDVETGPRTIRDVG